MEIVVAKTTLFSDMTHLDRIEPSVKDWPVFLIVSKTIPAFLPRTVWLRSSTKDESICFLLSENGHTLAKEWLCVHPAMNSLSVVVHNLLFIVYDLLLSDFGHTLEIIRAHFGYKL